MYYVIVLSVFLKNSLLEHFKIKIFFKALLLTLKKGPGCLSDDNGRIIHLKSEYIIKINSLMIVRDINRSLRTIKYKVLNQEKINLGLICQK